MKILLIALLVSACASKPDPKMPKESKPQAPVVSIESKQLASEQETNLVAEINFRKSKSDVSKQAKNNLKDLFKKAHAKGKIQEIKVITWADQEYPSERKDDLSKQQQTLVSKRNKAIEKCISQLDNSIKIDSISMAERPSALGEMFSSDDAQIKKSLETAGIPNTDSSLKVPGKASKSVVIFLMDEG
jgi:PBP1b-binding outer membrane lipoprotein LpoB